MTDIPPALDRFVATSQLPLTMAVPKNGDHPIVAANGAFERLTGYGQADLLGRDCRLLQGQRTQPAARRVLRTALDDGSDRYAVVTNYRRDGTEFDNFVFLFPIFDADDVAVMFVGSQFEVPKEGRVEAHLDHMQFLKAGFADLNAGRLGNLYVECGGLSKITAQSLVLHRLQNLAAAV